MAYSQIHTETKRNTKRSGLVHIAARLVSDIANPLLMPPLVMLALACLLALPASQTVLISGIALVCYTLIPFGITLGMLNNGKIRSFDIPRRENRERLFLYTIISTSAGSLILIPIIYYSDMYMLLAEAALVFMLNPLIGYLISRRFKVSIHTGSLATAGALFLAASLRMPELLVPAGGVAAAILFVLIPAMIWARSRLRVHSYAELAGGVLAGLVFTLLAIGFMQLF